MLPPLRLVSSVKMGKFNIQQFVVFTEGAGREAWPGSAVWVKMKNAAGKFENSSEARVKRKI